MMLCSGPIPAEWNSRSLPFVRPKPQSRTYHPTTDPKSEDLYLNQRGNLKPLDKVDLCAKDQHPCSQKHGTKVRTLSYFTNTVSKRQPANLSTRPSLHVVAHVSITSPPGAPPAPRLLGKEDKKRPDCQRSAMKAQGRMPGQTRAKFTEKRPGGVWCHQI